MQLDLGTFDEPTWALLESTTPSCDILSRRPKHNLIWSLAYSNIPVRTPWEYPVVTESELSSLPIAIEYNCHLFKVADPDEERLLRAIKDRIYSGWYVQIAEETKWDDHNNILIWLTWAQYYFEEPKSSGVIEKNV